MRHRLARLAAHCLGAAALLALSALPASAKSFTIALIPGLTTDPFYITMHSGAEAAAKALGVTLMFQGAPEFNSTLQV
ncbi:MAG: ABC transporter substrate-binding protein, partial [Acetobacteraceae bacterium]